MLFILRQKISRLDSEVVLGYFRNQNVLQFKEYQIEDEELGRYFQFLSMYDVLYIQGNFGFFYCFVRNVLVFLYNYKELRI